MTPTLVIALLVQAQVYTWTDADGVQHFTDDVSAVPKAVKARKTDGAELGKVETGPQPVVLTAPAPPQVVIVQQAAPEDQEEKWRRLFREARAKVTSLEDDIEADRKQVEEVNGMPMRAGFTCQQYMVPPVVAPPTTTTSFSTGVGITATAPGLTVSGSGVTTSTTGVAVYPSYPTVVAPCTYGYSTEYQRVRERLEKNRRELVRAKEELQDLDRRASFAAVPLHWRR